MKVEMTPQLIEAVVKVNSVFKDFDKTKLWMTTENPHLGFIAPVVLINAGCGKKLLQIIDSMIEGDAS